MVHQRSLLVYTESQSNLKYCILVFGGKQSIATEKALFKKAFSIKTALLTGTRKKRTTETHSNAISRKKNFNEQIML